MRFERSGGFANIRLTKTLDTASMTKEEAQELARLVEEADFFDQSSAPGAVRGADRFQYAVTVESEDGRHSVRIGEEAVPEKLRPLLDYLTDKATER